MRRRVVALALGAALLGGCAAAEADTLTLRLVVRDNAVRAAGAECAGSRPYLAIHAGAPYRLESGAGEVLARGALPPGRAEPTLPDDVDVPRVPTFCVVEVEVGDVPPRTRYRLALPEGEPLEFDSAQVAGDGPVVLTVP